MTAAPAVESNINLDVTISGITKSKGEIRIAIYSKDHDFPSEKDILDFRIVPVKGNKVQCSFQVKEKGTYAMALIHDVNGSGKLDYNWVGFPSEPFGFSNNPKVIFKAPTFEECAVEVVSDTKIEIKL
jgi:uncharacterized protein (DUF2141 family)